MKLEQVMTLEEVISENMRIRNISTTVNTCEYIVHSLNKSSRPVFIVEAQIQLLHFKSLNKFEFEPEMYKRVLRCMAVVRRSITKIRLVTEVKLRRTPEAAAVLSVSHCLFKYNV